MSYIASPHLFHCTIGDRVICLDVRTDRYFQLNDPLRGVFLDALSGHAAAGVSLSRLISADLLRTHDGPQPQRNFPPTATDSVVETKASAAPSWPNLPEIGLLTAASMIGVKTTPLHQLLSRARTSLPKRTKTPDLATAAAQFNTTRRLVPLPRVCLHDSLAMKRFLGRRGFDVVLVFGVALNPFSAHCWLQAGSTVLNDTLDRAIRHTPLLAI
ncbi:lasso peptide biosynthesis B2 protein [Asticcacaulis sp. YBE204]|uniref:lasso peptide biosynthesis B2 protein n=1 Tax=Asticcacaulis sp. YBE204 TaxID=1282363 RepID=UPI0003C3D074|nr:lasso peptide biosynthesis B2 protein [Asticcacaulis sp. YBE204]ESQ78679.1 hypothetical protein AEYBE204_11890 [Asticcacaulis sp. YBE204]